jgi:trehalose 6-phosphate phosphatase
MKYLFDCFAELEEELRGVHILHMLDFDGTLAPIAATPIEAELPRETREVIERLSNCPCCTVAIVSGRALSDVRAKVGIEGITYVGNHGLEVALPGARPSSFASPDFLAALDRIKSALVDAVASYGGVFVEDKGCSVAVHYRTAAVEDRAHVKAAVYELVRASGDEEQIEIGTGSMVLEIRPAFGCNKGSVVRSLIEAEAARRPEAMVKGIYIGDDVTDEDAFKAIRGRGWGILVGAPRISYGEYSLKDPKDVRSFLETIAVHCGGGA